MKVELKYRTKHCVKRLVMWCAGFLSEGIRFCIFKPTLFHCSNKRIAVVVENSEGYAKMAHNAGTDCRSHLCFSKGRKAIHSNDYGNPVLSVDAANV